MSIVYPQVLKSGYYFLGKLFCNNDSVGKRNFYRLE